MSVSPTITPTISGSGEEELISLLCIIGVIVIVGIIFLCIQCCMCMTKPQKFSSSDSFPPRQQPTLQNDKEDSSESYMSIYHESSSGYY